MTDRTQELELRVAHLEQRLQEPASTAQQEENLNSMVMGLVWAPVVVSVFAWLSGSMWAWIATGCFGVAAVAGAVALVLLRARRPFA